MTKTVLSSKSLSSVGHVYNVDKDVIKRLLVKNNIPIRIK